MNLGIISSNVLPLGPLNARERKQSFSLRSKLPKDLESSYIDTTVFRSVKSQEGRGASRDSNKDTTQLIAGSRERVADVPIDEPGVPLLRLPSAMSRNASPTGLSRNASPAGRPGTSDLTASADRKTGSVKAAREAIRASAAVQSGQGQQNYGTRPSTSRTDGGDNASGNRESNMWGIWKTVSVQVVNEDAVPGETITVVQGPNKGPRISKVEQQWEGMLRGR